MELRELEASGILNMRTSDAGVEEYLVQYADGNESPSWEPRENLSCEELVQEFLAKMKACT